MEDYPREIDRIHRKIHETFEVPTSSLKHTEKCQTCKKRQGRARVDNGIASGTHCDKCREKLVSDCRKRSW